MEGQKFLKSIIPVVNSEIPCEIFTHSALFPTDDSEGVHASSNPLMAFKASTDPDTMYMHEAMPEPDREEFRNAMQKEVRYRIR